MSGHSTGRASTRSFTRRMIAFTSAAGLLTGAAFFGCGDIFHSTDFSVVDGGVASLGFCSWSEDTAKQTAAHACALVAACQSPIGGNAVGTCIARATLAYDCAANPNHPVIGEALAYWTCVSQAKTCNDVNSCVYGNPPSLDSRITPPTCGGDASFTTCGQGTESSARLDCRVPGQPALGESCAAIGQTCVPKNGGEALCVGDQGVTCKKAGCGSDGQKLDFCVDAGGGDSFDQGIDCASFGAGKCILVADAGPTCMPLETDAGTCAASGGIRCNGDLALGCGAGIAERVNCAALADGVSCIPSLTGPAYDLASSCFSKAPTCSADTCSGNGALLACVRGAVVSVDCGALGLGSCAQRTTSDEIGRAHV